MERILGGSTEQFHHLDGTLPDDPATICQGTPDEPSVVVIGPEAPIDEALRLAARFDLERPDVSVVLVAEPSARVWAAALRAGARDVLPPDAGDDEMHAVLVRARQSSAARRRTALAVLADSERRSRLIAVASPKGGSGKTTVATNLAVGLARVAPQATVLVDLDLHFGDVATALGLVPEHDMADTLGAVTSGDALELKTYLTRHPAGLYVLGAPDSPIEADRITGVHVTQLLELLSAEFRYVVADTAPGLSEHTLAALEQAREWVLVCSMDVPCVRGLRRELETLAEVKVAAEEQYLVVNVADTRAGLTLDDVERTLGRAVDVTIPRAKQVAVSTNQGVPLLLESSRGPAARELQRIVDDFSPPEARRSSALRRLLARARSVR